MTSSSNLHADEDNNSSHSDIPVTSPASSLKESASSQLTPSPPASSPISLPSSLSPSTVEPPPVNPVPTETTAPHLLLPIPTPSATSKSRLSFTLPDPSSDKNIFDPLPPELTSADITLAPDGSFIETSSGAAARELKRRYDLHHGVGKDVRSPYAITAFVNQHGKQMYRLGHRELSAPAAASAEVEERVSQSNVDPSRATSHSPRSKRRSLMSMHTFLPPSMFNKNASAARPGTANSSGPRKLRKTRSISELDQEEGPYVNAPTSPSGAPAVIPMGRGHSSSVTSSEHTYEAPYRPANKPGDMFGEVMDWLAPSPTASTSALPHSLILSGGTSPSSPHSHALIVHPFGSGVSFDSPLRKPAAEFLPMPRHLREMQSFESGLTARQVDHVDIPEHRISPVPSETSANDHDSHEHDNELNRPPSALRIHPATNLPLPDDTIFSALSPDESPSPSSSPRPPPTPEPQPQPPYAPLPETAMLSRYSTDVFDVLQTYRGLPLLDRLDMDIDETTVIKLSLSADESAAPRDDPRFVIWGEVAPNDRNGDFDDVSVSHESFTDLSTSGKSSGISRKRSVKSARLGRGPNSNGTSADSVVTPTVGPVTGLGVAVGGGVGRVSVVTPQVPAAIPPPNLRLTNVDAGEPQKILVAATIERWIAQLTSDLNYDELLDFFLTYRTYISAVDLCHLLICRFHWALQQPPGSLPASSSLHPPAPQPPRSHFPWQSDDSSKSRSEPPVVSSNSSDDERVRRIVRVRTFVAIRYWLLTFFAADFLPNRELRLLVANWLNTLSRDPILKQHGDGMGIVRRLIKVAKECKQAHSRAPARTKQKTRPNTLKANDPHSAPTSPPVTKRSHVFGEKFAEATRKLEPEEEDSDLDLDFFAEESGEAGVDGGAVDGFSNDGANAHLNVTHMSTAGFSPTARPSSIPLSSLSILQRTEHAPGPGHAEPVLSTSMQAPAMPMPHNAISRVLVKTIGRLGRWKRVLNARNAAQIPGNGHHFPQSQPPVPYQWNHNTLSSSRSARMSIGACSTDVASTFDLELVGTRDLLLENAGLEQYLQMGEQNWQSQRLLSKKSFPALGVAARVGGNTQHKNHASLSVAFSSSRASSATTISQLRKVSAPTSSPSSSRNPTPQPSEPPSSRPQTFSNAEDSSIPTTQVEAGSPFETSSHRFSAPPRASMSSASVMTRQSVDLAGSSSLRRNSAITPSSASNGLKKMFGKRYRASSAAPPISDRASSFRSNSTESFGVPLTSSSNFASTLTSTFGFEQTVADVVQSAPVSRHGSGFAAFRARMSMSSVHSNAQNGSGYPGQPQQPWQFDVVSIDDLDFSDTSSYVSGVGPSSIIPPSLGNSNGGGGWGGLRRLAGKKLPQRKDFEFVPRSDSVSSMGIIDRDSMASERSSRVVSGVDDEGRGLGGTLHQWQLNALVDSLSDDEDQGVEDALKRLEGQINPAKQKEKASKVDGWVKTIQKRMAIGDFSDDRPRWLDSDEEDLEDDDEQVDSVGSEEKDADAHRGRDSSESGFGVQSHVSDRLFPAQDEEAEEETEDGHIPLPPGLAQPPGLDTLSVHPTPPQTTPNSPPSTISPSPSAGPSSPPRPDAEPAPEEVVPTEILQARMTPVPTAPVTIPQRPARSSNFVNPENTKIHRSFILGHRAEVLAQHFAMIDRELFMGVKFEELVVDDWMRCEEIDVLDWSQFLKDRMKWKVEGQFPEKTTALAAVRARFNLMANFVLSEVVLTPPSERHIVAGKFIRIAWKSYGMSNFNAVVAIITGLQSEWVAQATKRSWNKIGMWEKRMFNDLKSFITNSEDFKFIRRAVESIIDAKPMEAGSHASVVSSITEGPSGRTKSIIGPVVPTACIPFIGVYLSQLHRLSKLPDLIDPTSPNEAVGVDPVTGNFDSPAHPEVFAALAPLPSSMHLEPLINVHKQRRTAAVIKSLVAGQHLASRVHFELDRRLVQRCLRLRGLNHETLQRALSTYPD
ncbi:ras GEF [Pluteus cervinus]|uniref:Ras GEF n=1 Tax=Pluteus cervinus TaxID=181527 RepID=A0ACD3B2X1_9AGAR|nr:ras GEF [Pluteus cervinus]